MESFDGSIVQTLDPHVRKVDEITHRMDDLWTESQVMQETLVDTCQLSVEFSLQSTRVSMNYLWIYAFE